MASITTSTASSASFFAILLRPERRSRAVREVDGSSCRHACTAWKSRVIESAMIASEYRDSVAIVLKSLVSQVNRALFGHIGLRGPSALLIWSFSDLVF